MLQAQPFRWPVRVYYEDTDSAGVVYYANYLRYLERARSEWLRALGFEQTDLATQHRIVFVVRALSIEYLKPARFNDELGISVELTRVGASLIVLRQCVTHGGETLATAEVKVACVNVMSFRPVRIPAPLLDKIRTTT